jgi:hypothetical protein
MADMVRLAGIDVSKQTLDVHVVPNGESRTVAYDAAGLVELCRWLVGVGVALVALEASGGYERQVSEVLEETGIVVRRLNPLRVRRFAELRGRLAKTDRLDARTIAEFARAYPEEQRCPRDPRRERLAEHLLVRRHAQDAIVDCTNQLEHLRDAWLRRLVLARQAALKRLCDRLDRRLAELIAEHDDLADLSRPIAERSRRRSGSRHDADRPAARARIADPTPGRGPGRRGTLRPKLRPAERSQEYPRRTSHRPKSPLHGGHGGLAMEPRHRSLRRPLGEQAWQSPPRRLHAKAHRYPQRHGQGRLSMATSIDLKTRRLLAALGMTPCSGCR